MRKLLLIVGQSVVPPFPLVMDLLSTPLRTDCTRACERDGHQTSNAAGSAGFVASRSGGAILCRGWIPRVRGNTILMVNGNEKQRFSQLKAISCCPSEYSYNLGQRDSCDAPRSDSYAVNLSRPGILAVRAVNQYRRRDVLPYLGLRYYLYNNAARQCG